MRNGLLKIKYGFGYANFLGEFFLGGGKLRGDFWVGSVGGLFMFENSKVMFLHSK